MMTTAAQQKLRVSREGISLLEVIISIGVISIGLLGVLSVLPLAGRRVVQGSIEDGKSMQGQAWTDEFQTRGYADPNSWVTSAGAALPPGGTPTPVLIDPHHVAVRRALGTPVDFPFTDRDNDISTNEAPFSIPRISVRNSLTGPPLDLMAANLIFTSQNDLVFSQPADTKLPPVQEMYDAVISNRRMSAGHFSWMAMIVPLDSSGKDWRLSVVVFHDRDPDMSLDASPANDDGLKTLSNERVATVSNFMGNAGIGGGPMEIRSTDKASVKVKKGDWVLLSSGGAPTSFHQWYRVADTDPDPVNTAGVFTREVLLEGADWPSPGIGTTSMTMVKGVVGVYESTFRLETNSLFH
ncbi:hypothetical protein [Lignipirellula cremea]|uniref:Uncharacterized protein n=1 Tax=Lignipirellula cremea TaxID=2528010 RepID=A0A518DMH2_9BACT|nr:hypothetical protein [Lignipirellula cremea]QDU93038.1 hypothetical protein Pla8534_08130 [Lignipirellula cremea]